MRRTAQNASPLVGSSWAAMRGDEHLARSLAENAAQLALYAGMQVGGRLIEQDHPARGFVQARGQHEGIPDPRAMIGQRDIGCPLRDAQVNGPPCVVAGDGPRRKINGGVFADEGCEVALNGPKALLRGAIADLQMKQLERDLALIAEGAVAPGHLLPVGHRVGGLGRGVGHADVGREDERAAQQMSQERAEGVVLGRRVQRHAAQRGQALMGDRVERVGAAHAPRMELYPCLRDGRAGLLERPQGAEDGCLAGAVGADEPGHRPSKVQIDVAQAHELLRGEGAQAHGKRSSIPVAPPWAQGAGGA